MRGTGWCLTASGSGSFSSSNQFLSLPQDGGPPASPCLWYGTRKTTCSRPTTGRCPAPPHFAPWLFRAWRTRTRRSPIRRLSLFSWIHGLADAAARPRRRYSVALPGEILPCRELPVDLPGSARPCPLASFRRGAERSQELGVPSETDRLGLRSVLPPGPGGGTTPVRIVHQVREGMAATIRALRGPPRAVRWPRLVEMARAPAEP